MDHPDTQLTKLLRYAKSASPEGLRTAVRPVVQRVLPEHLRAELRDTVHAADRWIDNHYTIQADGQKRHFFFLCGCFKSGTHWVPNLLNLHPHASIRGEFHFEALRNAVDHLTNVHWFLGSEPALQEVAVDASEVMIRRMIFAATRERPGAIWLGDRSPNPLRTIIRGAPQIIITRDVRDVLVSWSFHHMRVDTEMGIALPFREKWKEASVGFHADPEGFNPLDGLLGHEGWVRHHARHWANVSRQSREALPRLRKDGTTVLELQYEQMHADLAGEVARLYKFLNLDPALAMPPSAESKTLAGFKKEDRRSFFRKGEVGEWQETLTDRICTIIKEEAGEEMVLAGYEENLNW
jgi:hypothetical protein